MGMYRVDTEDMSPFWRICVRFNLGVLAAEVIIATIFLLHESIALFYHTSFKFVALFLLLILASNILAKIAILYIQT